MAETNAVAYAESELSVRKQCILMLLSKLLAKRNQEFQSQREYSYKNFIQLDGPASAMVSTLSARRGVYDLFQMTQDEISSLVPRVRIFKSHYDSAAQATSQLAADFNDVELLFGDAVLTALYKEDEFSGNVGLKSFTFDFNGGDPATKYYAECNMEIICRSLSDLAVPQGTYVTPEGKSADTRILDLLVEQTLYNEDNSYNPEFFNVKIVVGWAPPDHMKLSGALREALEGMSLVMLLDLRGWEIKYRNDGSIVVDIDFGGRIEGAMMSKQTDIFADPQLILLRARLEQQKARSTAAQGRIDDAVSYLKQELGDTVVLSFDEASNLIEDTEGITGANPWSKTVSVPTEVLLRNINPAFLTQSEFLGAGVTEALQNGFLNTIAESAGVAPERLASQFAKLTDAASEQIIADEETLVLEENIAAAKTRKYARLLQSILAKNNVFYFDIPKTDLGVFRRTITVMNIKAELGETLQGQEARDLFADKFTLSQKMKYVSKMARLNDAEAVAAAISAITAASVEDGEGRDDGLTKEQGIVNDMFEKKGRKKKTAEAAKKVEGSMTKAGTRKDGSDPGSPEEEYADPADINGFTRVEFFFLGDLIDAALDSLRLNESPLFARSKFLFGSIIMFDGEEPFEMPISDIPVSIEVFNAWFTENVVKKQRDSYLFKDFIRDVIRSLIPAVSKGLCFEFDAVSEPQVDATIFSLPADAGGDVFERYKKGSRVNYTRGGLSRRLKTLRLLPFGPKRGDYAYILFNSAVGSPLPQGDVEEDFGRGIYHFYVGNEKGLVKTINWKKVNNVHIEASNYQKSAFLPSARILATPNDAEIVMVGNGLFKPGMKIFINPTLMGLGRNDLSAEVADMLLLRGYYDVISVSNTIGVDGFETRLETKWTSWDPRTQNWKQGSERQPGAAPSVEPADIEPADIEAADIDIPGAEGGGTFDTVLDVGASIATGGVSNIKGIFD